MKDALYYFLNNDTDIKKTAKLYGIDRKKLSKFFKQICPNYSIEQFKNLCSTLHKNKYDYSLVKFNRVREKIIIICPIHGQFEQEAFSHKKGISCHKCSTITSSLKRVDTTEEFIKKCILAHGEFYDYTKSIFIGNRKKVTIICPIHGEFIQSPDDHKQGKGCNKCARENIGWTKTNWKNKGKGRLAKLYTIRCWNNEEEFYKIGRTFNTIKKRYGSKKEMPYNWEIIEVLESTDYEEIWKKEIELHRKLKNNTYKPKLMFGGMTECYAACH